MNDKKVLVISVGGTPEQTAVAVKLNALHHVIFFCSEQTYRKVPEICEVLRKENFQLAEYERIVTKNPEELGVCYSEIMMSIPVLLERWDVLYENLVIDYTGGTKAMSAALVLATVEKCNHYSYLGGNERTKDGLGTVVTGSERHLCHENPWNTLAISQLKVVDMLFNKARYISAVEKINEIRDSVDEKLKDFYNTLSRICKGYYEWDCFRHQSARNEFDGAMKSLRRYQLMDNTGLRLLIDAIEKNVSFLTELAAYLKSDSKEDASGYRMLIIDLISNAKRRAEKEGKFDDAVARLYSSVERVAKMKLLEHGINNSRTRYEDIPENLIQEFENTKFVDSFTGETLYRYGFAKSCQLLSAKDPMFAEMYMNREAALRELMMSRNNSILAHGNTPVKESLYLNLLEITMDFLSITAKDLIDFPEFKLNDWGSLLLRIQSTK